MSTLNVTVNVILYTEVILLTVAIVKMAVRRSSFLGLTNEYGEYESNLKPDTGMSMCKRVSVMCYVYHETFCSIYG